MTQGIQEYPDPSSWALARQPTEDELQALEPVGPRVPVEQAGPVRVQQLGSEDTASFARSIVDTTPSTKLLNFDDRRSQAVVWSTDQPFFLGTTLGEVDAGTCAKVPINTPITLKGKKKWYARSATPATPATVSCIADFWTN